MNHAKAIIARAARIKAAVTAATASPCPCPGARIEELLGEEIAQYPDKIMSLDVLPSRDGFEFIGFDADFNELPCLQLEYAPGKFVADAGTPLVGWKPIRIGGRALTGRIRIPDDEAGPMPDAVREAAERVGVRMRTIFDAGFRDDKTAYEESEPYRGTPFCKGKHSGPACKDPFCSMRR